MSYIKIENIKKETVETPEVGHVYFGYDDFGFWVKKDDGSDATYILEGVYTDPTIIDFVPGIGAYVGDQIRIDDA